MFGLTAPRRSALLRLAATLQQQGYRFTTVTPATHQRVNDRAANRWAQGLRDIFGWNRPFLAARLPLTYWELVRRAEVVEPASPGWRCRIRLSSLDEQLYLHSGFPTTADDAVFFGPDSYRFVGAIHQWLQGHAHKVHRAADLGCGAGPGAITIARACPTAEVMALDINPQALALTDINARLAGAERVYARHSDLLREVAGCFDLIVANPPFMMDRRRRQYRHGGDGLGMDLSRRIVVESLPRLRCGGTLLLYTGVAMTAADSLECNPLRTALHPLLSGSGLHCSWRELDPDIFGEELEQPGYGEVERIAALLLRVTRLC